MELIDNNILRYWAIGWAGNICLVHTPSSKIEDLFHDNTLIKAKSMEYDTDLDVHEFTRILCNIEEKE